MRHCTAASRRGLTPQTAVAGHLHSKNGIIEKSETELEYSSFTPLRVSKGQRPLVAEGVPNGSYGMYAASNRTSTRGR
jgi:hypothetical protein